MTRREQPKPADEDTGGPARAMAEAPKEGQAEAEAAGTVSAEAETPAEGVLVVIGPASGFRRAGRTFGPEPEAIPLADLSEAEIAALIAEPMLGTTRIAAEAGQD